MQMMCCSSSLHLSLTSIHVIQLPHPWMQWLRPHQWEVLTTQKVGQIQPSPSVCPSAPPSVCLSAPPPPSTTTTSHILTLCVAQHRIENMRENTNQWRRFCQPFQLLLVLLHFDARRATSLSGKLSLVLLQRNSPVASVGGAASLISFSDKWLLCFNSSLIIATIKAPYNINI